jgi:hypothetical protein
MDMLVRTPQPHQTESLLGYVLRVSEANGYETPARMLASIGAAGKNGQNQDIDLEKLAAVVGCDIEQLRKIANKSKNSDRPFLLGRAVSSGGALNALRLGRPAFCPHCVEEDGYVDAIWDLGLVAACPKHRCAVTEGCSSCGKALTYRRPGILTCNCGANLASVPKNGVSDEIVGLTEIIFSKARGISLLSLKNAMNFPTEQLEQLSLPDFCELLILLGRLAMYIPIGIVANNHLLSAKKVSDTLSDWPNGFHRLLLDIDAEFSSPRRGNGNQIPRFKHFYVPMFAHQGRYKRIEFLHDEFIRFNRLKMAQETTVKNVFPIVGEQPHWVSQSYLISRWGISSQALRQLLDHGGMPLRIKESEGKSAFLIDISRFEPIETVNAKPLPRKIASFRYGIPSAILIQLRKRGVFSNPTRAPEDGPFDTKQLDDFQKRMIGDSKLLGVDEPRVRTALRMDEILGELNSANTKQKTGFIITYLSGKIPALGRTGESIADLVFEREQVNELGHVVRPGRHSSRQSYEQTANLLETQSFVVQGLVNLGYLEAIPTFAKNRKAVTAESIKNFRENWKSIPSIALSLATFSQLVQRVADENGIFRLIVQHGKMQIQRSSFVKQEDVSKLRELCISELAKEKPILFTSLTIKERD